MENNKQANEQDEFIESSQAPTLRSKVRQKRPNYNESSPEKRPSKRAPRDNRTVSQCIRAVWKHPQNKVSSTTTKQQPSNEAKDEPLENEYIKFASQQQEASNVGGIQPAPSVSLFAQQEDALARYLFSERTEAQVEEQLQKLLDGFQAEYEKECATMESSPVHLTMEHDDAAARALQSTPLPGANGGEIARLQEENVPPGTVCPLQAFISEQFLIPNISEEIAQLVEMVHKDSSPFRTDPADVMAEPVASPIIPIVELREETSQMVDEIPIATGNVCLDLSVQKQQRVSEQTNQAQTSTPKAVDDGEWLNASQKRSSYVPSSKPHNSQRSDDILDLRKYQRTTPQTVSNPLFAPPMHPSQPYIRTLDCGTQTKFRGRYRNVGIQHRPVASLDFTDRNMIVLAQQFEADPIMLERKLRRVAQTASDPIWRARDLSAAFTVADPYYANLKHFL